jgi:membrane protease YdiL (CAAX protease family)
MSGTRPSQLGLTRRRLVRNVLAGALGALLLTPLCLGLNWLVVTLYHSWGGGGTQEHPLTLLAEQHLAPAEWLVWGTSAVVAAPLVEELVFRGMLQPWFAGRRWGGHAAMAAALLLTLVSRAEQIRAAWLRGDRALADASAPALFVLALVPCYLLVCRFSRTPAGPAVFGTALLFASVHAFAWPTPVALFVLALGLGWLAWRTQSLAGPIVLHALFNGVSALLILLLILWQFLPGRTGG